MTLKNSLSVLTACLLSLLLTMACSSHSPKTTETAATQSQEITADEEVFEETMTCERVDLATIQTVAPRAAWPNSPTNEYATYVIESGVDNGVWVEGKGYFKMTPDDAYQHFIDPQIIGPLHMTKTFERTDFSENNGCASFLLKVKMKYILSIEFELSHSIYPISTDRLDIGFIMHVKKSSGTSHIKEITNTFIVKKFNDDYISIEAQSLNKATMNKPDETRQAVSGIFDRLKASIADKL